MIRDFAKNEPLLSFHVGIKFPFLRHKGDGIIWQSVWRWLSNARCHFKVSEIPSLLLSAENPIESVEIESRKQGLRDGLIS